MDNSFSVSNSMSELLSDEELIKNAQNGDGQAVSVIVMRFIPMVKKLATSFKTRKEDVDDLSQEGLIALINAIYAYKFNTTASFTTFAFTCVKNRMISVIRKNVASNDSINFGFNDDIQHNEDINEQGSAINPEQLVLDREKIKQILYRLNEILSPLEYDVLMWHSMDFSYDEISEKLGVSSKSVDNALQRIRRKISYETFI